MATALPLLPEDGEPPLSGRNKKLLQQFNRGLTQVAPGASFVIEWQDRFSEGEKEL
ncbi:hypothetical protein KBP30_35415 [Streptomyces sp. Go40/10]|uniref:hypothetical protein n=1 Tax=Streptomyces sp. Go40/10 TaxID=2825844 RepID=UPI001E51584E|nr:hypothetical protein [Streptomyces sp. Go40/10]UFR06144.1 hypothetical protein KBP30_35415 [Streptomyces sp. Go40/10]